MLRHVDYVKEYAANLVPVIPYDAKLVANTTIDADDLGKVPGERGSDGLWHGIHRHELRQVALKQALKWDKMCAGVGWRTGWEGVFALDVDIVIKAIADAVLKLIIAKFGPVAVRRVDHPEHHKPSALA
jgi:hypothetical protein